MSSAGLLSILMPVYNERPLVRTVMERVLAVPLPDGLDRELVVVDDGSTDGTGEQIRQLALERPAQVRAFFQPRNYGKGAALRRAVEEMRGDYAIVQDADLEYDPSDYSTLLRPILEGRADVVFGSRFAAHGMRRVLNYHHALGNLLLTHFSNLFTGLNLTDLETGYKAFRGEVLKTIPLRSNRFGFEPEIAAKVAKRGCAVYEVPINYYGRTYLEGKKITWKDGLAALYTILKYWLIDDCFSDRYGHEILISLSRARRLTAWIVAEIAPYLGQRIVEIGAGIGSISRLLPKRDLLTVTDVDPQYLDILRGAFRDCNNVSVAALDLNADDQFNPLAGQYDTVVCLNVLEHIRDDQAAVRRMRKLLTPGGRLILLVPQHVWLYGNYDRELGHYRRYSREGLQNLLQAAGYKVLEFRNFNALPILPWWFNGRVLRARRMGRLQLKLFDLLVPVLQIFESVVPHPGISALVVAEAV